MKNRNLRVKCRKVTKNILGKDQQLKSLKRCRPSKKVDMKAKLIKLLDFAS
jgi:hypothetical protein